MVASFAGPKHQHECRAWWAYALPKDCQKKGSICAVANDTGSITHNGYRGSEVAFEEHALRDAHHPAGSTGHIMQPRRQNLLTPSRHKWGEYHGNSRVQSTCNEGNQQYDKSIELDPQWYNNFTVLYLTLSGTTILQHCSHNNCHSTELDHAWHSHSTLLDLPEYSHAIALDTVQYLQHTFYSAGPCMEYLLYNTRSCMVESPNNTEHT